MKGGIMNSQRVQAMAGYMPPALPFAQLPNPDSVIGPGIYRLGCRACAWD